MTPCPLKPGYWERTLQECRFAPKFQRWLLRSITEGVNLGYKGEPRDHGQMGRVRSRQEIQLLEAQYTKEKDLGRVVEVGKKPPEGKWFPKFFVSPTYTIPKKKVIAQPQKWRLIHNLSDHAWGHSWSINAGISKADFPVIYPSIPTAAHEVFCRGKTGCVLWGRDLTAYYRHLMVNPA